jgi:hypothetical protein
MVYKKWFSAVHIFLSANRCKHSISSAIRVPQAYELIRNSDWFARYIILILNLNFKCPVKEMCEIRVFEEHKIRSSIWLNWLFCNVSPCQYSCDKRCWHTCLRLRDPVAVLMFYATWRVYRGWSKVFWCGRG